MAFKHTATEHGGNTTDTADLTTGQQPRVIKKYPNRRLYDTHASRYITLAEVKQFVASYVSFVVQDTKTGANLTRSILLQILLEEEAMGVPMFSQDVLAQLIRFYGHTMQGALGGMLEKNIQAFGDMQRQLGAGAISSLPDALQLMGTMVEQSQTNAAQLQEHFLAALGIKR